MIIGVDVDGVLADFNASFINRIVTITGRDLFPPRPFDIPTWDYPQFYGYSEDEANFFTGSVWADIKADPTFWLSLPNYTDTVAAVEYLHNLRREGHDIYFITNRAGVNPKQQTERWLRRRGYDTPTVLLTAKKGSAAATLGLDAYIDDKWENAIDVATNTKTRTYLMTRPWNRRTADRTVNPTELGIIETDTVVGFLEDLL